MNLQFPKTPFRGPRTAMMAKPLASLCLVVAVLVSFRTTAPAAFTINWSNPGVGFTPGEAAVVQAGIDLWESLITDLDGNASTSDVFTLTFQRAAFSGIGITGLLTEDGSGIPTSATILIDDGSNFNFFVDPTPSESSEFTVDAATPYHGIPTPGGIADPANFPGGTVVDLLELVVHEMAHALGFGDYTLFEAALNTGNFGTGTILNYGPGQNASLVAGTAHFPLGFEANDLMSDVGLGQLTAGERWLPSALDLDILAGVYGYDVNYAALTGIIPEPSQLGLLFVGILTLLRRKR